MTDSPLRTIQVFLVDDHPAVRQGLSMMFKQTGLVICGEADTITETLKKLDQVTPDIVLVDLSLDQESGFDLLAELAKRDIKSIIYTMHRDPDNIEKAFRLGANGYVTKRDATGDLLEALADVMNGKRHISKLAAQSLAGKLAGGVTGQHPEQQLSEREQEIIEYIRRGFSTADIAKQLIISPRTVESYYTRILEKLKIDGMKSLRRHILGGKPDTH